jgi:hypothetical protein
VTGVCANTAVECAVGEVCVNGECRNGGTTDPYGSGFGCTPGAPGMILTFFGLLATRVVGSSRRRELGFGHGSHDISHRTLRSFSCESLLS